MDKYTPPAGYTPTDEEVKDDFLNMGALRDDENAETLDRWYRWLAEHDRAVAANAWDEGFNAGHYIGSEPRDCDCKTNPYRITEENN